jgi:hypothetical protein
VLTLIQVYLPAIEGHVPQKMVQALQALMDFIYIARRDIIDANDLIKLDDALERFHNYRTIFQECGIRPTGFNLPRQHSLIHYHVHIQEFGAPNGLCSSITESKHIKAVKEPWRRSSRFNALGQMLLINQRLDNLAASRVDFASRGMLEGTCLSNVLDQLGMNYISLDILLTNFEITQGLVSQAMLSKRNLLSSFLKLRHTLAITMRRVTLLALEFWHIPTWQKQSVSCHSGHFTCPVHAFT